MGRVLDVSHLWFGFGRVYRIESAKILCREHKLAFSVNGTKCEFFRVEENAEDSLGEKTDGLI